MRKRKKVKLFPATLFPERHGGEDGGIKGSERAAKLVVLDRFESVRRIEGKKQADRGGPVRRDGPEHEGEVEPGPRPRLSGQILDRDQNRQRRNHGWGCHGGKKHAGPGHQKGGQKQT